MSLLTLDESRGTTAELSAWGLDAIGRVAVGMDANEPGTKA